MTKNVFHSEHKTYFTIIPTKISGFTDKLNQFSALYRLGSSMGFQYYHTDFKSPRSSDVRGLSSTNLFSKIILRFQKFLEKSKLKRNDNPDVFDFIGFNRFLNVKNESLNLNNFSKIKININRDFCCENHSDSIKNLKTHITQTLSSNDNSNKFLFLNMQQSGRDLLEPIFLNIPSFNNQLKLRDEYFKLRKDNDFKSEYNKGMLKILVHIREGDTAVIKTPWGTYISAYSLYKYVNDSFMELENLSDIKDHRNIDITFYKRFIEELISFYDESKLSVLFFSDGFKRAFKRIYNRANKLNLSKKQKKLLIKSERSYDNKYFKMLKSIENSKLILGEGKGRLYKLIHSIFEADVIVIGNKQSMIPKLLGVYFDITNIPKVVVLYKKKPPKYHFISKETIDKKFFFVDVDSPSYEKVFSRINLEISDNQAQSPFSQ